MVTFFRFMTVAVFWLGDSISIVPVLVSTIPTASMPWILTSLRIFPGAR